jgi:uncharacterized membrane protein YvlD (DUF360 family)
MQRYINVIVRFGVVGAIDALSLLAIGALVPGITLSGPGAVGTLFTALLAAVILSAVNVLVRPLLILLTLPINVSTLGLSTLLVNGAMLRLTAWLLPGFAVEGWPAALAGALSLAAVNTFLTSLTTIDDDYAFFDGVVQWLSKRQCIKGAAGQGRGLVVLQIDGLSYSRARRAVRQGWMPTVRAMLRRGTHLLSPYDCGLPSQTSACQAGIMYGDNFDIPAFRWYDKDRRRMIVSNDFDDAAELNARYARGHGLLRGGSSITNHMSGDAARTLLTMSVLGENMEHVQQRRLEDMYLFMLNPYLLPRTIVLVVWDLLIELAQALRQHIANVQPRVNRLGAGYPLLRAVTNVFLRDLATYMAVMDVIHGVPAVYVTYVGYDEIAHHAGPDTRDALKSLRGLDGQIRRLIEVIERKAPRPYDIILLSDHGQSAGATFCQRYGQTLAALIRDLAARPAVHAGTAVAEAQAPHDSRAFIAALLAEMRGMEQQVPVSRLRGATIGQARRALQGQLARTMPDVASSQEGDIVVCASGNLAHVYFTAHPGKVGVDELGRAYPGLVDALAAHPGVGWVVVYDGAGTPWVLGKQGARNLSSGEIAGRDPLAPYGDPDHRAAQIERLARFPHAGDLIANSTLYPDGQVAAFEELVGSHGGLGGQQTEPFILHPPDMRVPHTSSAADLFALLDARRGLPGRPYYPQLSRRRADAWMPEALVALLLIAGLGLAAAWLDWRGFTLHTLYTHLGAAPRH